MADMYLLAPESEIISNFTLNFAKKKCRFTYFPFLSTESDETLSKWRWHNVKKVGMTPCPRSGISSVGVPGTNKVLFFGGVQDVEENDALDVNINFTVFLVYFISL